MLATRCVLFLLLLCCLRSVLAQAPAAPDLQRADTLLRNGQADAAWLLLEPYEFEQAGNEDFDYLLGIAALESGRNDRASFILERVIGVNPNHAAARLDLARALFALQDFERARVELLATLKLDPPPAAKLTIERYLAAIEERRSAGSFRITGYMEAGGGTDTNINAGVTGGSYLLPILNANLTSVGRRVDYGLLAFGAEVSIADDSGGELFAGGDVKRRHYRSPDIDGSKSGDFYDTRSYEGRLGVQQKLNATNALRFTAAKARSTLDDTQGYRSLQTLMGEWRHTFDAATQGSLWLMDLRTRYGFVSNTSYRQYNGNQLLAGLGLVHAFGEDKTTLVSFTAYGGAERATDMAAGNIDGDKRITGLRLGGQWRVLPDLDLTAGAGGSLTRYELVNSLFFNQRRDYLWDASVGALWRFAPNWTLKPQFAFTRSDSNFGAYDYDRQDYSLTLRYDFR